MTSTAAHPARLRTLAAAHGLGPFELGTFRYLELGSGDGDGLLALAARFPACEFVGTDRPEALARARRSAVELGLGNVRFVADEAIRGTFDYVVATRGFAERDADGRRRYLESVGALLAVEGIALVVYDVLPWGAVTHAARRALVRSARPGMSLAERVDAAVRKLDVLGSVGAAMNPAQGALLGAELERLAVTAARSPTDLVEAIAVPLDVAEVVETARAAGLDYVCDAAPASPDGSLEHDTLPSLLERGVPRVEVESLLDLFGARRERASLLAHGGRLFRSLPEFTPLVERGWYAAPLHLASEVALGPEVSMTFVTPLGAHLVSESPRFKALLLTLAEEWPRGLTLDALVREVDERLSLSGNPEARVGSDSKARAELLADLSELVSRRAVELLAWTPTIPDEVAALPRLSAVVRQALERGRPVLGARHEPLSLDPMLAAVALALDGKRALPELCTAFGARLDAGEFDGEPLPGDPKHRQHVLTSMLLVAMGRLRRLGLLDPPPPESDEPPDEVSGSAATDA